MTTLELDVQITDDGHAVVTHDRRVSASKCRDTAPAFAGDPEFPYVGDYVKDLTLAQVWTLDCGRALADHPGQRVVEGARIPLLSQVFALADCYRANRVWFNIETKVEAGRPSRPPRASSSSRSWRLRSARRGCSTASRSRASTGAP